MVAEFDIKLAIVLFTLAHGNGTRKSITSIHLLGMIQVEDGVLPMGVWLKWWGTESNFAPKILKMAIKPGNDAWSLGGLMHFKVVLWCKVYISLFHVDQIKIKDLAWFRDNSLIVLLVFVSIQVINARLLEYNRGHDWHVDIIDVTPELLLLSLVVFVLNCCNIDLSSIWQHLSVLLI